MSATAPLVGIGTVSLYNRPLCHCATVSYRGCVAHPPSKDTAACVFHYANCANCATGTPLAQSRH
jgi:hypothetical protein